MGGKVPCPPWTTEEKVLEARFDGNLIERKKEGKEGEGGGGEGGETGSARMDLGAMGFSLILTLVMSRMINVARKVCVRKKRKSQRVGGLGINLKVRMGG